MWQREIKLRGFWIRFISWIAFFAVLGIFQFQRNRLEWVEVKLGAPELNFYLMPATVGFQYLPEVYPKKWISTHTMEFKGLPFDNIRYEKNRAYKELDKAVYSGTWHAYYFSNGGVHWTAELTFPLWSVYLTLGFFFARYIRFRPRRTAPYDAR